MKKLYLLFLISFGALASITFEAEGLRRDFFTLKEACEEMGHQHNLLIKAQPPSQVDCMGRLIQATDFCLKKERSGRPPLLRGVIDRVEDQVVCETGLAVQLGLDCQGSRGRRYCDEPETGCQELGQVFARKLVLAHSAVTGLGEDTRLNCFYSAKPTTDDSLELIPMLEHD